MDRRDFCHRNASSIGKSLMRNVPPSVIISPSHLESNPAFQCSMDHALCTDRLTPERTASSSVHHHRHLHHRLQQQQQHPVPHQWIIHGTQPSSPPPPPPPPPQISAAELLTLAEASSTANGTFRCHICGKQFGYKNGLIRHVRLTHVGEKPYECNICNRRFGYKHILLEHQNLHFGNRPYVCTQCDKRFAARSNLIQHQTIHRRPFNCTLCSRRFDREEQLKKHLHVHPDLCSREEATVWAQGGHEDPKRCQEAVPDSSEEHLSAAATSAAPVKRQRLSPTGDGRYGNRIDAICSQLSAGKKDHVVVKQELVDSTYCAEEEKKMEGLGETKLFRKNSDTPSSEAAADSRRLSAETSALGSPPGYLGVDGSLHRGGWCPDDGVPSSFRGNLLGNPEKTRRVNEGDGNVPEKRFGSAALPGICEVFSRRSKPTGSELPPLANLVPLSLLASRFQIPDLVLKMRPHEQKHHQHHFAAAAPKGCSFTAPIGSTSSQSARGSVGQRPTAQLPPIALASKETKDQAIQHSTAIGDFPPLEEVLSHYVNQGRLFRCQHCDILFFERGTYFLHSSLHGTGNPWECSICHKVCLNKNEFTLHFVNQQHSV